MAVLSRPVMDMTQANTMRALVKREAAKGIWMEQVPVPVPGPNEVLIKLEKTAICGTDLHIYLWDEWSQRTIKPGLTIGHEFVGRIAQLGSAVTGFFLIRFLGLHASSPGSELQALEDGLGDLADDAHERAPAAGHVGDVLAGLHRPQDPARDRFGAREQRPLLQVRGHG